MVFESVFHWNAGHPDINASFERIAFWIESKNRGMFGDFIVQQNHVNAVVKRLFFQLSLASLFQHQLNPMLAVRCPDHSSVLAARKMSTKGRPLDNFHG